MNKIFRLMILVVIATMTISLMGGCTSSKTKKNTVDIGIVLPTKDEPRWVQDEARFKEALKDTDYSVEILFSQGSSAREKENVEALLAKGIKTLIICAHDGAAAAAAVESAKKDNVKVIAYDRLITGTDAIDYYVTFDSIAVGEAQAQYLIDNTKGLDKSLYLYAGAASDNNAFLFFEGAWNKLQPKIADGTFVIKNSSEAIKLKDKAKLTRGEMSKIIDQVTTNWDFNAAKSKAEAHLTSAKAEDKKESFVLAPNDGTARAIADVFKADTAVEKYFITGQDAEKASIQYIIDEKQSMTVFKDVRTLVKDAIDMALALLENKEPETTGVYNNGNKDVKAKQTEVIVVNKDNVKSTLIDSEYYSASEFKGLE